MSRVYQVTARAADATLETIVEFQGQAWTDSAFEMQAKAFAKQAITRRWRELYPRGSLELALDLSVQRLPDTDEENVSYPGLGPYRLGIGIQVWITNAPNSWGWGGPPPRY
jgi:hypothetical protein